MFARCTNLAKPLKKMALLMSYSNSTPNFPLGQLSQLKATSRRTHLNWNWIEILLCRGDSLGHTSALAAFIEVVEHDLLQEKINSSSEEDSVSSRKSSMESVISTDYSSAMTDVNSELEVAATTPNSSSSSGSQEGNNNSLPKEISCAELELLKKLEEQNR